MSSWLLLTFLLAVWISIHVASATKYAFEDARAGVPEGQRRGVSLFPGMPAGPLLAWAVAWLGDRIAAPWGTFAIGGVHAVVLVAAVTSIVRHSLLLRSRQRDASRCIEQPRSAVESPASGEADEGGKNRDASSRTQPQTQRAQSPRHAKWSYSFNCDRSTNELREALNAAGPWKWEDHNGTLLARTPGGATVQVFWFIANGRSDNFLATLEIPVDSPANQDDVDKQFRGSLTKVSATNVEA